LKVAFNGVQITKRRLDMSAFIHKNGLQATEYKYLMTNAELGQAINKYK